MQAHNPLSDAALVPRDIAPGVRFINYKPDMPESVRHGTFHRYAYWDSREEYVADLIFDSEPATAKPHDVGLSVLGITCSSDDENEWAQCLTIFETT
ncbi:hypothetical protein GII36_01895 [Candidatus Mycosynbacter amalyticus]|uniref:Uncharacterized protein n=1 Tax=Candidatus Mycosynbacter amalyticus TaxID=2665156 RepID=A0A857MN72_9BACT|nr:hypothetical protein [Candidatus Mycosynbacter amalyticus]QHN42601.1 hypothetical protein GII36_01895 [Candidatus Mycosynbacter amalyticus]